MPRALGVRQLPSKRCGCQRCRDTYPTPERTPTKNCTGNWQARWYDAAGNRQSATRPTKAEAIAEKTRAEAAIDAGTYLDPGRGKTTVAQWHETWIEARKVEANTAARNSSHWTVHVEPRWGRTPLRSISHMDVQKWVIDLEKRLAEATVRPILNYLDMMLGAAMRDKRIPFNPCDDVKVTPAPKKHARDDRPPTIAQIESAVAEIYLPIYQRIPLLILETGLRWGEFAGLTPDAVDLGAGLLDVVRVLEEIGGRKVLRDYPKSDAANRTIPLTRAAVALLQAQYADQPAETGEPIFRGPSGGYLARSWRGRVWIPAARRAGIHREVMRPSGQREHWPTMHDLRHTWASRLENGGVPESTRKEVLGHERPRGDVTWRYTHGAAEVRGVILRALGDDVPETPDEAPRRLRLVV